MIIFLSFYSRKNTLTGISHIFILTQYTRVIGIYQEKNYNFRKISAIIRFYVKGIYKQVHLFANHNVTTALLALPLGELAKIFDF